MSSPRCTLPIIVIEDAPKKSTIRQMSTPGLSERDKGMIEHEAKEGYRTKFAHASKSQVKSLISVLNQLNEANMKYHIMLLQLKPDSRLSFKVNDQVQGRERNYDIDNEKVKLGMETFNKGLRNIYFYYKYRGTKKSKRTGDKEADNLEDLRNFRVYHRHLWVVKDSILHQWIMKVDFADGQFNSNLRNGIASLVESNNTLTPFKDGKNYLHILNSTIQNLFFIYFEARQNLKIKHPKNSPLPKEQKQASYNTTQDITALYRGAATHQVTWDEKGQQPVVSTEVNTDPNYAIGKGLTDKITLRKQHNQLVYHDFDMGKIYMTDFMSITALATVSAERMRGMYERYRQYTIQQAGAFAAGAASNANIISYEEFRGDVVFGENLIKLQQFVSERYRALKTINSAGTPATVRAQNKVALASLLNG